jgi:hypothetical protein
VEAAHHGQVDALVGEFESDSGQIAVWQQTRNGPNGPGAAESLGSHVASDVAAICYYDGAFKNVPGPPATSTNTPNPSYDRLELIAFADGSTFVDRVGPRSAMQVSAP